MPRHDLDSDRSPRPPGDRRGRLVLRGRLLPLSPSPEPRHDGATLLRIVGERTEIPSVVRDGAGDEVRESEEEERQARERPRGDRPPRPLDELGDVVRRGEPAKGSALRNAIVVLAGFAQGEEDPVGVDVPGKPRDEQKNSEGAPRIEKP